MRRKSCAKRTAGASSRHPKSWGAAEGSLKKSVALFDLQIERALKSDSEFSRTEHAGNRIGSKARSLSYLGTVYLREGRKAEAFKAAEVAYEEVIRPHVQATFLSEVVRVGISIAQASGDQRGQRPN